MASRNRRLLVHYWGWGSGRGGKPSDLLKQKSPGVEKVAPRAHLLRPWRPKSSGRDCSSFHPARDAENLRASLYHPSHPAPPWARPDLLDTGQVCLPGQAS